MDTPRSPAVPGPPRLAGPRHRQVPDIYLGVNRPSPQHGVLGEVAGRTVALDLNETHTISLFGVQGGGKSYTLGSIIEAASLPAPPVNVLPHPLATVVFHYSQTRTTRQSSPRWSRPTTTAAQLAVLRERYGAEPAGPDGCPAPRARGPDRRPPRGVPGHRGAVR